MHSIAEMRQPQRAAGQARGRRAAAELPRSIQSARGSIIVAGFQVAKIVHPRRLKNCTARSCRSEASRVLKVPRFRRFPVRGSGFREYSRYSPDFNLRIIGVTPM